MSKPSNFVEMRVLRTGAVRDGRKKLARGDKFDAHPVEAEYLASIGAAEPVEAGSGVRSLAGRAECAAKRGPIGR